MTADEIKELRLSLNMSQQGFAEELGCEYHAVMRWERGISRPSPLSLKALENLRLKHLGRLAPQAAD